MGNKRWEGFWMWPLIQGFLFFFFSGRVCVGVYFLILCVRILSFVFSSGDGVSVSVIFLMWDQMMECWGVGKGAFLSLFLFQVLGCVFFIHDPNSQLITLSLSLPFLLFITHPNVEMHGHQCDEDWEMPKIQIQFCWIFFIFLFQKATMYDSLIPLHFLPLHKY